MPYHESQCAVKIIQNMKGDDLQCEHGTPFPEVKAVKLMVYQKENGQ